MPQADNVMRVLTFFCWCRHHQSLLQHSFSSPAKTSKHKKNNSAREVQFQATPRKSFFRQIFTPLFFYGLTFMMTNYPGMPFDAETAASAAEVPSK